MDVSMGNRLLLYFLFLLSPNFAWAEVWSLHSENVPVEKNSKLNKSLLKFKPSTGAELVYTPASQPWVYIKHSKSVVRGDTYYITQWLGGARNVHYKIFNPDKGSTPVCEITSDAEKTQLRFYEGKLQIKHGTMTDLKRIKHTWVDCLPKSI